MERPRDLTVDVDSFASAKKKALAAESILADLGHARHPDCILCGKPASTWVIEVAFPFSENKSMGFGPLDYPGPLPGLCYRHDKEGAEEIAGGIFYDQPSVQMSQPKGWVVTFTDGSQVRGHIYSAIPENLKVEVQESFAPKADPPTE